MDRQTLLQFTERLRQFAGGNRSHALDVVIAGMARRRELQFDPMMSLPDCPANLGGETLLDEDDALGQVHQALNAASLEAAYRATARDRRKFSPDEIPAVSQLFTPKWVVEFILHNTLGKLWIEMHPDSRLVSRLNFLHRSSRKTSTASRKVAELRVLDPACGTMNFGLVAFELLREMYREEIDRAGQSGWPAEPSAATKVAIADSIARNNLYGVDIDPQALRLARVSLDLKAGRLFPPRDWNLFQADALFDESTARRMDGKFDVVVTNPPYVSSRNLAADYVRRMKKRFPQGWRDLYACFIDRALDFAAGDGRVGILAMQSFMFTGAYEGLRARIVERASVETLAHFGPGLFSVGNPGTLQTVAFTLHKESQMERNEPLLAIRLTETPEEEKEATLRHAISSDGERPMPMTIPLPCKQARGNGEGRVQQIENLKFPGGSVCEPANLTLRPSPQPSPPKTGERGPEGAPRIGVIFRLSQSALSILPRRTWAYWIDQPLHEAFTRFPRLATIAPPRQGLATTDNFRFVRYAWEIEPTHAGAAANATPGRWFPYAKSGKFRRWYEQPRHRVNWQDDGRQIKNAIVERYPYLNGKWQWVAKNTRYYGGEGITWSYLTSGRFSARRLEPGAIFDVAGSSLFPDDLPGTLALLNSSVIGRLLAAINPTVNFQVGDLAELPIPPRIPAELAALARRAIALLQQIDSFDESAPDFSKPTPWHDAPDLTRTIAGELATIERQIDLAAADLYHLAPPPDDSRAPDAFDPVELARRWVSRCVWRMMGRWNGPGSRMILQLDPPIRGDVDIICGMLIEQLDEPAAAEIDASLGGIGAFLAGGLYSWHVKLYRGRPPLWAFRANGKTLLIAHDAADRPAMAELFRSLGETLPADWTRCIDDGIALNLAPLCPWVADAGLRKVLKPIAIDAEAGRFQWAGGK